MAEAEVLWGLLRGVTNPAVAEALEREVASAPDHRLARINPLAFALRYDLRED